MTDNAKKIKETLDTSIVSNDTLNQLIKDRIDFGFDSIYFRYAEVCDELAMYKAIVEHTNPIQEKKNMFHQKMHFYEALEQLLQAHEEKRK
jgi:hypothetical protein